MQQFTVPQFIDVEDKIIGPITTRQFIIMLAGSMLIGVCYKIFDFSLFLTSGFLIFIFTSVFAFVRVNGRPFHYFLLNLIQTLKKPKLRVWNHTIKEKTEDFEDEEIKVAPRQAVVNKHYTSSRLAELSLMVDTKGAYAGEKEKSAEIKTYN